MWRKKANDDAPLDKLKEYKEDLKRRLKSWTIDTYGISQAFDVTPQLPSNRVFTTEDVISSNDVTCAQLQSTPETGQSASPPPKRGKSIPTRTRLSPRMHFHKRPDSFDKWRNRRMLRVGHVPFKGHHLGGDATDLTTGVSSSSEEVNPVLYYEI